MEKNCSLGREGNNMLVFLFLLFFHVSLRPLMARPQSGHPGDTQTLQSELYPQSHSYYVSSVATSTPIEANLGDCENCEASKQRSNTQRSL